MNIAMFTNLYLPLVGGIQRSIATFKGEFEARGHHVLVATPQLKDNPLDDPTVVEVPAIQNYNGSDFAVALPLPGYLSRSLDAFEPHIVHSHHPFLLGDAAVRAATKRSCPLVFTYHTMWEHYLHYAPSDSPTMQDFVKRMAAEYCDLCDHVIAPCESIACILRERGVKTPITAIPTGIDTGRFQDGDGRAARKRLGIPSDAFVAGYIGRLGPEKNLVFVAEALTELCSQRAKTHALIVGDGEGAGELKQRFEQASLADRLHMPGILQGQDLVDAYHALDVFAFASQSETQGLVLAEAMAAGRPVVALDAPGARDIVRDGENGRLLERDDTSGFAQAVRDFAGLPADRVEQVRSAAVATAERLSRGRCAADALELYENLLRQGVTRGAVEDTPWARTLRQLAAEWQLWSGRAAAAGEALTHDH
jgi:glycosyltransferase involved in cell wall biosynthesis